MPETEPHNRGARFLLVTASVVIVVAGLREIKPIALPFLVALFLSILSSPLFGWLLDRRVPRFPAALLVVLSNVAIVLAMLMLVGGSIRGFADAVPRYQEKLEEKARKIVDSLDRAGIDTAKLSWLRDREALWADEEATLAEPGEEPASAGELPRPESWIDLGSVWSLISSTLLGLASLMTATLLILLLMVFILSEGAGLSNKLEAAFRWDAEDLERMTTATQEIQRYLGIKTLISLATGVFVCLWLSLLGVDFPLVWGLIAFLFNYIPSLGSIIAAIPAVIVTWITMGLGQALIVAFGYLAVNMVLGNFLEPHLLGRRFGISTLVVFLSLIFWGWLWGPVGMLLSIPLTMTLRIMLKHTEDLRWLALLLGANPATVQERAG